MAHSYFQQRELNLHAIELICEDLHLHKEIHHGYREWKRFPQTRSFFVGGKEYHITRLTLHERLGVLFYTHTKNVSSEGEVFLQAFEKERLIQTSIICPEDFLNPLKSRCFESGLAAHMEYAKIRAQAIVERRHFVEYF